MLGERPAPRVRGEGWLPGPEKSRAPAVGDLMEAYLRATARTRGSQAARETRRQLRLFVEYAERTGCGDVSRLPWWEYVLALSWIGARLGGGPMTRNRTRRLLDTLRDFLQSLVSAGHLDDCDSLEQARALLGRTIDRLPRPSLRVAGTTTVLVTSDGQRLKFSSADLWLCLLWRLCGRSWTALEGRLAQAPSAAARIGALGSLRRRLAEASCADPLALLGREPSPAETEEALRWLARPTGEKDLEQIRFDLDMSPLDTPALIERVAGSFPAMPRREMEELLRRGDATLPGLTALLSPTDGRPGTDPLWAIVLLGELRRPEAVPALVPFLARAEGGLGAAAADALAKIGPPAVPALVEVSTHGGATERVHAYAALGLVHTDDAHLFLLRALFRDPGLGDVLARALALHGRREAIEPVYLASTRAPRWMRREFESAIWALVHGAPPPEPFDRDWRVRYRRLPGLDWSFPPSWVTLAALAHRRREEESESRNGGTTRSLGAIIADARLRPDGAACPLCGGPIWRPTGVPVCRHAAPALLRLQAALLDGWLGAGLADVWCALDSCDAADLRLRRRPGLRPLGGPRESERDTVAVGRATLYWLVGLGREDLRAAVGYVRAIAHDFALLAGGAALPPRPARRPPIFS